MDGSQKPDYASPGTQRLAVEPSSVFCLRWSWKPRRCEPTRCVSIVTRAALREMVAPGLEHRSPEFTEDLVFVALC